ncbi:nuclear factor of activated T-cells 5-like [Corticium candelabrum]|uniref:nuclear factor of activated T-cells 5-like n=1 Tax=Corticium candelabrum TaxID=121492 RepID=UPI002E273E69|nr:nuclear factor of activated T-cells 5-like [Corticium candelabrum]
MALHQEPGLMREEATNVLENLDANVVDGTSLPSGDIQALIGSMIRSGGDINLSQLDVDQRMPFGLLDGEMGVAEAPHGGLGLPNVPNLGTRIGDELATIDMRDIAPSEESMTELEEVLYGQGQQIEVDRKYRHHASVADPRMMVEERLPARDILQHDLELQRRTQEQEQIDVEKLHQLQYQRQQFLQHPQHSIQLLQQQPMAPIIVPGSLGEPQLVIINQPYPCQKKRYKTDGLKRGIIKAANNIEFPTVQIEGYSGVADIVAYAATSTADPHPFYEMEVSPDSYNTIHTTLSDGTACVQIATGPTHNMRAIFSGISTKRIKMKDVKQRPHYDHWLPESEIVHLGFIAFIPNGMQPQHVLSCLSQSIDVYDSLPELPVLRKAIGTQGPCTGGYDMCLVGLHFAGARVRFFQHSNTGVVLWERLAEFDPQDCTETHLVVKVPPYPTTASTTIPVKVHIEVLTGPAKMPRRSAAAAFIYTDS